MLLQHVVSTRHVWARDTKELLDKGEQDIRIIQTEVSVICRSEVEADNAVRGLNNSDILRKPNSIILLSFIIIILLYIIPLLFKTSRSSRSHCENKIIHAKYRCKNTLAPTDTRFICHVHVCTEIRKIICKL
jgi:hypothetical protein